MSLLSKLFGRGQTVTRAQAITALTGRPMLMHAGALDTLIATAQNIPEFGAYLAYMVDGVHGSKPEHITSIAGDVGTITIKGPLFPKYDAITYMYDGTAYSVISAAFDSLIANDAVSEIVMLIDSRGGQVTGCFELAEHIHASRGIKPITAVADDSAYSAAYAIASAADRFVIPVTGGAGSVGVRSQHVSIARALDQAGYDVTTITSGSKKAAGDSTAKLSDEARGDMQAEVDRLADIFISMVARNRGLDVDAVRALQGGCLYGPAAIAAGLADEISGLAPDNGAGRAAAELARATQAAEAERGAVSAAINAAGLAPEVAVALMQSTEALTRATVAARIVEAREISNWCFSAGLPGLAAGYAKSGTTPESARAQLLTLRAGVGEELITSIPPAASPGRTTAATIYDRRAAAAGRNH